MSAAWKAIVRVRNSDRFAYVFAVAWVGLGILGLIRGHYVTGGLYVALGVAWVPMQTGWPKGLMGRRRGTSQT
jgi:hypothetical protein